MKKSLLFFLPLVLLFFSCKKESLPTYSATFDISKTVVTGTSAAFKDTLQIKTDVDWDFSIPDTVTWVSVSPKSGSGNGDVIVAMEANPSPDQRDVNVTVNAGSVSKVVKIIQAGSLSLSVSKTEIDTSFAAFKDTFQVVTMNDWRVAVPDTVNWITVSPLSGNGISDIAVAVDSNNVGKDRSVALEISTDYETQTITIHQSGNRILMVSDTAIDTTAAAFKDTIAIVTVNNWKIEGKPDWMTLSKTMGSGKDSVRISADENISTSLRSADLKVITDYDTVIVSVSQEANTAGGNIDVNGPIQIKTEGKTLDLTDGGEEDRMYITGNAPIDFPVGQSFSISLKIKVSGASTTQPRILYWNSGSAYLGLLIDRNSNDGKLGWFLVDKNGSTLRTGPLGGSGSAASNVTTHSVEDGEWHHVALVYDAVKDESYIYLDGEKEGVVGSLPAFGGISMGSGEFIIGDFSKTAKIQHNWNFGGYIEDLNFWNKALTKKEVYADAANISLSSDADDVIAGFDFDELSDDKFPDVTGNYEGVLIGNAGQYVPPTPNPYDLLTNLTLFQNAGDDNYRCPGLVVAKNGDILLVADKRVGSNADVGTNSNISLIVRRSTDNGETWSDIEDIGGASDGGVSDPAVVVDRETGDIFVFGSYAGDQGSHLLYMYKSTDNGKTWTGPIDKTNEILNGQWPNGFKFIASGHGLYTNDGKLMFVLNHVGDANYLVYSDDNGATWNMKSQALSPADESKVVELNNGNLMVNARAGGGYRHIFESSDGGDTWTDWQDTDLPDPYCNAGIVSYTQKRNTFNKNRLLFSNCASTSARAKTTVKLSYDGGQTWAYSEQISPYGAYSSINVLHDGIIGLAFETNHGKIKFVRFNLKYLTRGADELQVHNFY